VDDRCYTARPMAMGGSGAFVRILAVAKPDAIGFAAATPAWADHAGNGGSGWPKGPRGERAG
jgi:hypothetical protein